MTPEDFAEFTKALVAVADVFDAELSESKISLYFQALADLELYDVLMACEQSIKELKFFPKPAELRDLALGNVEDSIEDAWIAWKNLARKVGAYADLEKGDDGEMFSWPVLFDTITAVFGSWPQACRAEFSEEMWAAKRKEFGRVYHTLARRGRSETTRLLGLVSKDNLKRFGIAHPKSRLEAGEPKLLTDGEDDDIAY